LRTLGHDEWLRPLGDFHDESVDRLRVDEESHDRASSPCLKTAGRADKSSDGWTEVAATEDAMVGDAWARRATRMFAGPENAVSWTGEQWLDMTAGGHG